jgi:long-subunit fatty acid transport protein
MRPTAIPVALPALALTVTSVAAGNPLDMFGLGARGPALAGAMSALCEDVSAAYYNPAGLALSHRVSFAVGYSLGVPRLRFDEREAAAETARGVTLGISIPREISGTTAAFGIALYFPDQRVVRVRSVPAALPRFVQYDNRLHRIAVHPALAWRPWPWLAVGAGLSILADAKGAGADIDLALDFERLADPTAHRAAAKLDVQLPTRVAPVVGLWARLHPRVRAGLTFRGALSLELALETRVAIDAGILQGRSISGLTSSDYFSPDQLSLGLAFDVSSRVTLAAEATWYRWSGAPSPLPVVRALLDLGIPIDVVQVSIPSTAYQPSDVVVPRLGIEARLEPKQSIGVDLRSGISFEPSPYPRQTGVTSLADNDKLVVAVGAGLTIQDLGATVRGPLRFDVYLQAHLLWDRLHPKDNPCGPTPTFRSGGSVWAGGMMLGLGF